MAQPSNFDNVIDSREIIERIAELEAELQEGFDALRRERYDELLEDLSTAYEEELEALTDSEKGPPPSATFTQWLQEQATTEGGTWREEAEEFMALDGEKLYDDLEAYIDTARRDLKHTMFNEACEYKVLKALEDEASGMDDWEYGATLIREDYFEEYAQELAEDIGAIDRNAKWPNDCIDWELAARELQVDYTPVDFGGVTFYVRG